MEPLSVGKQKQLFIDDYCLDALCGVRRQLNSPRKHAANPILVPREPWEQVYVSLYGNVIYGADCRRFQMWYSSRFTPPGSAHSVNCVCHATSSDGVHWERTPVNRLRHEGKVLSNAVLIGQYIGPTVFHTPDDPDPQRRYRMFVFMGPELLEANDRRTAFRNGYGVLFSPDGLSWTEYEYNPVIQGGDIATCSYDPVTKEYVAFPKVHRTDGGIFRRCVGVSTSKDFMHWGASDIILSADSVDDARVDARLARFRSVLSYDEPSYYSADMYGMTGFRYEGLRLGLVWFYDRSALRPEAHGGNDEGVINIQLAYSRDPNPYGYWYREANRGDFLDCGSADDWDAGMVITAHTVVEVGDELWFYYTGFDHGHGWEPKPEIPKPLSKRPIRESGLGLATLRRDGFVSLDALYPGGTATTKLLILAGDEIEVNADAEHGQIRAEIQDHEGKPLPGYTREDCIPCSRDEIHGRLRWKGGSPRAEWIGKPVRLVFYIQNGKLFSFQFV